MSPRKNFVVIVKGDYLRMSFDAVEESTGFSAGRECLLIAALLLSF